MTTPLPWIKVYGDLPSHRKSVTLAALVNDQRAWTHVLELWLWVSRHAPDGDLGMMPDAAVARVAGWTGDATVFVGALRQSGFLDGTSLHGWDEHNGAHQRKATADKVRNARKASEPVVNKNNLTSESLVSHQTLTTVESIEYRDKNLSTKYTPPKMPEVADASEKDFSLSAEVSKPKRRGRPPKDPEAHAAERADADRWMAKVREITGLGEDVMRWSQAQFLAWRRLHKAHGIDKLMLALDGLANDKFSQTNGIGWFVSAASFQKGLALQQQRAARFGTNLEAEWEAYFAKEAANAS